MKKQYRNKQNDNTNKKARAEIWMVPKQNWVVGPASIWVTQWRPTAVCVGLMPSAEDRLLSLGTLQKFMALGNTRRRWRRKPWPQTPFCTMGRILPQLYLATSTYNFHKITSNHCFSFTMSALGG